MPVYHRVCATGELQFLTSSTYRRVPVFLSDRFRGCFVDRLEEVRRELNFLLVGWVLMREQQPDSTPAGQLFKRVAVVKLEILLIGGCVHPANGSAAPIPERPFGIADSKRQESDWITASAPVRLDLV
jgi:hypothetical protein